MAERAIPQRGRGSCRGIRPLVDCQPLLRFDQDVIGFIRTTIAKEEDNNLRQLRLALCAAVNTTVSNGMDFWASTCLNACDTLLGDQRSQLNTTF